MVANQICFISDSGLQTRLSALPQTGSAPYNRETSGVVRASIPMERADPEEITGGMRFVASPQILGGDEAPPSTCIREARPATGKHPVWRVLPFRWSTLNRKLPRVVAALLVQPALCAGLREKGVIGKSLDQSLDPYLTDELSAEVQYSIG